MRFRPSRRFIVVCCAAALPSLIACAPYNPPPSAGVANLATEPAVVDVEETALPEPTPTEDADGGTWQTRWGPLSPADRDLVKKVRLASLWEMPMAQDAMQRASESRVREISEEIASQHHTLDEQVREVADKLEITLPVTPTRQQQEWMADISSKSGSEYDATYVKWLRLAHGQIFPLIGTVRGSTQNTLVRRFSEQANAAVLNHQRLLESTGLTTPESFPTPPD